ncbi:response regulator [Phototrophicus methaneseepsis]|uniref:histidine kinase n=1 Tax=Phototrophicus methaneseepsis TaxID=2710758 RepID=A0A7S8IDV5_9CHLR|nr:response regulator [Phototrophicus methaneseepsis]QPC81208.1 response regulator [Phototrophicus methaneseepsis]
MTEQAKEVLVLVIDDQKTAADLMTRMLASYGYKAVCAYNGPDGIEQAKRLAPDLILLDVMMPVMDGFEVLQILRQNETTSNIPTIMVTAKDQPTDVAQGLQLGADDYIPKPIEPRELIARAKSKIESHQLRRDLQSRTTDLEALLRVSEELNNNLQIEDLVSLLLYLVIDLMPCEFAAIYRTDERGEVTNYRASYDNGELVDQYVPAPQELIRFFLENNEAFVWNNDEHILIDADYRFGTAVPLKIAGELYGFIMLLGNAQLEVTRLRLFEGIGRQATLSLRNAELYELKANLAEDLEIKVQQRTKELEDAQQLLIRSEKLASIGRLAAGIAHEINNPLTPILLIMEDMLEDVNSGIAVSPTDIEETLKSAKRISRIVERLLQFTRQSGSEKPSMEVVNIYDALQNVLTLSRKYLEHENINVQVDVDASIYVHGNRDQLEQVFLNLILNAKAAMPGGGRLSVLSKVNNQNIAIIFEDTGSGIPENLIDNIFEPFVTTKEDGTGLGLFISYGVIENHNGQIDVKSKLGKGTTMTVRLPRIEEQLEESGLEEEEL